MTGTHASGSKTTSWQLVSELFAKAIELPDAERDAFLLGACAGDDVLLSELRRLVSAHERSGVVDALSDELAASVDAALPWFSDPGPAIGDYRILAPLGSGGMGIVYLAARDVGGGDFQQRVAIKVLRVGLAGDAKSGGIVPRFQAERNILARLEHPNIPRYLDGGITRDGLPYFAMEYVEGIPIDDYCDRNRLDLRERLTLLVAVCDAMQYAHQHLVVHRDLKPSNILVTPNGVPKVLDFGIAKLLDNSAEHALTGAGPRWMTTDYASPEQVRGDAVTTAVDVFALGVLTYELLACRKPHPGANRHEVEQAILELEPLRPSAALPTDKCEARGISAKRIRRELSGDLDTITLKALSKAPDRRYSTAGELADDIRRYLHGRPVLARPDSITYRARKFVARHRMLVAALVSASLSIVAGSVATTVAARRAQANAAQAAIERDRAEQVSRFALGLFAAADPTTSGSRDFTARELLDSGAARLSRELSDQPGRRAAMLEVLAQSYAGLGRFEQAQAAITEAVSLRRAESPIRTTELATALEREARIFMSRGMADSAGKASLEALSLRRSSESTPAAMAASIGVVSDYFHMTAKMDSAEHYLREAIAMLGQIDDKAANADMLTNLAVVLSRVSRFTEAESLQTKVLEIRRAYLPAGHPRIASDISNRAVTRYRLGRATEARRDLETALDIRNRALGPMHPEVANTLHNLARMIEDDDELDSARVLYRRSLDVKRAVYGAAHTSYARTQMSLGNLERKRRDFVAAESLLTQSLATRRAALGDDHIDIALTSSALAALRRDGGRLREADALHVRALEVLYRKLPPNNIEVIAAELEAGATLVAMRRYEDARAVLTRARESLVSSNITGTRLRRADSLLALAR